MGASQNRRSKRIVVIPTETGFLQKPLPLYTAPDGELIVSAQAGDSIRVYTGERFKEWVQVEYMGRGAWAKLPKHLGSYAGSAN